MEMVKYTPFLAIFSQIGDILSFLQEKKQKIQRKG
jgi:hypothetical protein